MFFAAMYLFFSELFFPAVLQQTLQGCFGPAGYHFTPEKQLLLACEGMNTNLMYTMLLMYNVAGQLVFLVLYFVSTRLTCLNLDATLYRSIYFNKYDPFVVSKHVSSLE